MQLTDLNFDLTLGMGEIVEHEVLLHLNQRPLVLNDDAQNHFHTNMNSVDSNVRNQSSMNVVQPMHPKNS